MPLNAALTGTDELATKDLGPLAWVLDELRKSLDGASQALRRFVRDAELSRGSDLASLDASQLRIARQQLHQAVGALEMVGLAGPAKVLRAMEVLAQRFVEHPEYCSDEATSKMERASFALTEFLRALLKGKTPSSVALFPQYRDVLELCGVERVHPADLWPFDWHWTDVELSMPDLGPLDDASARSRVDGLILKLVKTGDLTAAMAMCDISLGFAAAAQKMEVRVFWKICAAYFEAVSLGLFPADVYGKRAASRILLQDRALARGELEIAERLVQDLLFFCAQAIPPTSTAAPVLTAVRVAYGITQMEAIDYETPQFGRFDPAQLQQARKRIAVATETWSTLAGGDTNKLKLALEQFQLLTDSVLKLHPASGDLARALTESIEATVRSGEAPTPSVAMEVATTVLFLEATYEDLDPTDQDMAQRSASLAERLLRVNSGGQPEPLEKWMEELYRRVSDRQIMGSVVDELRTSLADLEQALDKFFRDPADKVSLYELPGDLAQMRGVFSVLGLDQAALAVSRIRDSVETFLAVDLDVEAARTGIFEKLGNSLGTLGFLIDMLSYQRELAKKLFVYDEELGEFKPLMGSVKTPAIAVMTEEVSLIPVPLTEPVEQDDLDLKEVFLEEAREVLENGLLAIRNLTNEPSDLGQQTTLRRVFHMLKGSSRMLGLTEFGDAAWSMEQVLNSWLAEQKPAGRELLETSAKALQQLTRWVEDIAAGRDAHWSAQMISTGIAALPVVAESTEGGEFDATQVFDFDATQVLETTQGDAIEATPVLLEAAPELQSEAEPIHPALTEVEEQVKVIGSLRINIPLYNVYLNEADEWSRRLLTELSEWSLELHRPVLDSTVGLAHSLSGSSATVGFIALSSIARALEQALHQVQRHAQGIPEQIKVFIEAAEDIRRLLHQFAAGFLKEPDPALFERIKDVLSMEPVDKKLADVLDVDLFPIFEEETLELLPQLGGALRQWTARPENLGARNEALRVLHTLKGSARLAGAMQLGDLCHHLESAIEKLGIDQLQTWRLEALLGNFDQIQDKFDSLCSAPEAVLSLPEASPVAADEMPESVAVPVVPFTVMPVVTPLAPLRQLPNQTVRVRSQLLDRLVNQAGEVMITRSRLETHLGQSRVSLTELAGNLERLRSQLRDLELQSESQMQSRMAQVKDSAAGFDPLEFDRFTRVQELTRMMAETVHDVATVQRALQRSLEVSEDDLMLQARQARELQRDLLRTRMVEFDGISERLYGVVRQAAKDTNKQVALDIQGSSLDIDRGVLDRMAPVFEHLLRNAVAHGIESPVTRVAIGKPVSGTICIQLHQHGNDVTVEFSDDGTGLDLDRIRTQALATGLIDEHISLTDDEILNLIFTPGFSTASQVTELSGRGIGLDVVRAEVNALGGRIETSTEHGQGTRFKLVLPLTTAVTQVVLLRIGELVVGVPASLVEQVRRVGVAELERTYHDNVFEYNAEKVPFFWAGALLQSSSRSDEIKSKTLAVAIFRSAGQCIAAHVDEVLGNQEVVVKNLGPQLSRLPGLVGMSVLASGAVILIYNPVALAAIYGQLARRAMLDAEQAVRESPSLLATISQSPLVLVVDDSITVRRVTQRLLLREGFRVALAADGLQALERLHDERPAVVLSDIEMPRMDGFDLVRNIRGDDKLRDLPVIMITSRIAEKHREHARELGVDHYLGKPYSEDELITLLRQFCD